MYIYFARAYDKYDVAIVALALFAGEKIPPNHDHFKESNYGTTLAYGYNTYIVAAQSEEALMASNNIFALYILANLYSIKTKDDMERRLELKKKMFELAIERNIPLEKINSLFTFVFEIMALPVNEARKYKRFTESKFKEMTNTTFQKNRRKTQIAIVDSMSKGIFGIYASEMMELLEKKDNVLKEKDNVLKEQYEKARRLVIRFHVKDKETPETIANLTGLPLNEVNAIIKTHDKASN
jgi:hypothetical protein